MEDEYKSFLSHLWEQVREDCSHSLEDILDKRYNRFFLNRVYANDIRVSQYAAEEITIWEQITNSNYRDVERLNALIRAYARDLLAHITRDFMELMRKAKYILVCIHPNDNCIWEIQQSSFYFEDKTIYFIDSINNLTSIRKKMGDKLPDCLKSDEINHNHTIVYKKVNKITIDTYTNSEYGLSRVAYEIVSEK